MSDDGFVFELEPFDDLVQRGLGGAVGAYGQARVFYVKSAQAPHPGQAFRTELVSQHLPEAHLTGKGMGGQPYVAKSARLVVGGDTGKLAYNVLGVRRGSRALRISLADRAYTYTASGFAGSAELRRDGARVAFDNGRRIRGVGECRLGTAQGAADETDLALAILLERVDTSSLTLGGALAVAPFRLLSSPSDGGGE